MLPSVKDCLVSQTACEEVFKELGGSRARTADQSWPKEYSPPQSVMSSINWGQLAGRDWSLMEDRLDIGQWVGRSCIGHHWFLWSFFFISVIFTISSSSIFCFNY